MAKENKTPIVGISVGDINGIGTEVILKTLANPDVMDICTPVIFASSKYITQQKKAYKDLNINFNSISSFEQIKAKKINVFNCWQEDVQVTPGKENATGGKYAVRSLEVACQCLKDGQIDCLVTAPISKKNTYNKSSFPYYGHTPYLKEVFQADEVAMILYHEDLRVCPLTEHVAINEVSGRITSSNIEKKLNILLDSLKKDFRKDKPSIAVLGLNPHNGDNGLYGVEEIDTIYPTIEKFRERGHLVVGPFAADSFFNRQGYKKFDLVLGMYHDQVLIPIKMLDEDAGVNFTAGLSIIRTSPDHGTGFDIAGKDIAKPDSFRAALFSCINLYRSRTEHAEYAQTS